MLVAKLMNTCTSRVLLSGYCVLSIVKDISITKTKTVSSAIGHASPEGLTAVEKQRLGSSFGKRDGGSRGEPQGAGNASWSLEKPAEAVFHHDCLSLQAFIRCICHSSVRRDNCRRHKIACYKLQVSVRHESETWRLSPPCTFIAPTAFSYPLLC